MFETIKKIWNVEGLKRTTALLYWSVVSPSLPIVWPTGVPGNINKVYLIVGIFLSAVGLGHAAYKSFQSNKAAAQAAQPVEAIKSPEAPPKV